MANGHGGYRRPEHPAPVSGPGRLSRRTDGKGPIRDLPNAEYGGNQEFTGLQQQVPVSASPPGVPTSGEPAAAMPTPLTAPTEYPSEPTTAGADAGPGPGMEALGLPDRSDETADLRQRYGKWLPLLVRKADDPSSSQDFRDQVRYLIARIG